MLKPLPARAAAAACCALLAGAWVAPSAQAQGIRFNATVDSTLSYVVNSSTGGRDNGDLVAELRPGFTLSSRSGRVVGSLSYALGLSKHSRDYNGSEVQNRLSANLSAELIERWLYVDVTSSVSQQAANPFGQQSVDGSALDNDNRIEVGTLTVSPYVRGVLFSDVSYDVRLTGSATNGRRSITADSTQVGASATLSSALRGTALGWALTGSTQQVDYRAGSESQSDRYSASLFYNVDADLTLTVRGGQESNDVASISRTTYNNYGGGITWRPSPRTRAQLDADERYFGRSHRVVVEHRLASTSFAFTSSRDSSGGSDRSGLGAPVTLFQVFDRQFVSIEPDPALRELLVLDFLRAQGLDPSATVAGGFLNTAVTLQDRHEVSAAYAGRRVAMSLQAHATTNRVIDPSATAAARESVRQHGYQANASYRLSPESSVSLSGSQLMTKATPTRSGTDLKSLSLSWGQRLGRRTSASASLRYTVFNSTSSPYREAAISASLSHRF